MRSSLISSKISCSISTSSDTQIVRQKYLITTDGSEWEMEECGPHGPSRLSDTEVDLGMHVHA